jgi:CubicO group peptidase (beta-lactamase class C family)
MTLPSVVFPGQQWETRTPSQMGLDVQFLDQLSAKTGGTGAVVRHGYLCHTWGDQKPTDWLSAAKPVMSTMQMFAIAEGKLASADHLLGEFIEGLCEKDRTMTFRHLADMTSGYACAEAPGQAYGYNDFGIRLYGMALDRVFGCHLDKAAMDPGRLGGIGIEGPSIFNCRPGKHGVGISPTDFCRIGWLWLNRGRWGEKQLLPRMLFDRYCRPDVPADLPRTVSKRETTNDYLQITSYGGGVNQTKNGPGIYGFNWWFNTLAVGAKGLHWPSCPYDTFQANGLWGKYNCTVFPSMGLVVAASKSDWGKQDVPGDPDQPHNQSLKLVVDAVKD